MRFFRNHKQIVVKTVVTNNPSAGVIDRCEAFGVPCSVFNKSQFSDGTVLNFLESEKIDFIVLAGFLLLVPTKLIEAFPDRIINLHPALLPQHGGKGFYGNRVHESVIASGAIMSGITIHYVNERFDEGAIIFQAACHVAKEDTAETLAKKIHELEYMYLPVVTEKTMHLK